jgi:hypothetical protein
MSDTPANTRRRKLFVHIGMHKTGTTSIQKYYARNYEAALRRGLLFPRAAAYDDHHFPLALLTTTPERRATLCNGVAPHVVQLLGSRPDKEVLEECLAEMAAHSDKDALISSEAFSLLQPDEVEKLCSFFPEREICPIVFIRNFNDFAVSFYYTYLTFAMGVLPLEACRVEKVFPLDCVVLAERWARYAADGRTQVCSYDEILRHSGSIIGHFSNLIQSTNQLPAPIPVARENTSIAPYGLVLIRELRKAGVAEAEISKFVEQVRFLPAAEAQSLLPDNYRKRLESDYALQIEALKKAAFVKGGEQLPSSVETAPAQKSVYITGWSSAILALGRALSKKHLLDSSPAK